MKNTFKRISILASAFLMAAVNCFTPVSASGAEKSVDLTNGYATETIHLSDAKTIAGNLVMVQLSLNTGNQCMGYNLDVEFDSCLTLTNVEGAITWEVNNNVVTLVGFTGTYFADGEDVATLYFETPENASEGAAYDIGVKNVTDLAAGDNGTITDYDVKNSTVEVVEEAKAVTNHIVTDDVVGLRGDANIDGAVDLFDAIKVAKYMVGAEKLMVNETCLADVNQNNKVDLQDSIAICRYNLANDKSNAWEAILG